MKYVRSLPLYLVFAALFPITVVADDAVEPAADPLIRSASDVDLNEFVWKQRPLVVFADSENDPAFIEQMELLEARKDALIERDVVILTDTDPATLSAARKKLRPRGFMLVIMSKEGRVQLRKPFPWSVREISRSIDKLPIRQREIREAKEASGS